MSFWNELRRRADEAVWITLSPCERRQSGFYAAGDDPGVDPVLGLAGLDPLQRGAGGVAMLRPQVASHHAQGGEQHGGIVGKAEERQHVGRKSNGSTK